MDACADAPGRLCLPLALILLLAGCGCEPSRPNVLLLVMDTARADRCSVNGYDRPTTPRLEAIAAEGACFRNAWTPAGWTGPAHATLFTGLRPERHGYLSGTRHEYLPPCRTLAHRFAEAGYRTASFSNNVIVSREFGLDQGFADDFRDWEDTTRPYPYAPATHRRVLEWIRRGGGKQPFFVFINDLEPHYPYSPPREFEDRFMPAEFTEEDRAWARNLPQKQMDAHNVGVVRVSEKGLAMLSHLYDAEIACLDAAVGELVESLRAEGLLDDTIVVVVGDHGENLGDHGLVNHIASIHKSIRHVPLVIRYPAAFRAGTVVDDVVRLEDIPPTLLEICGLPGGEGMDGRTLLRDLPGRIARAAYGPVHTFLVQLREVSPKSFDGTFLKAELRAVTEGRWHLVRSSLDGVELYDVEADPLERRNLAEAEPEVVRRLAPLLVPFDLSAGSGRPAPPK